MRVLKAYALATVCVTFALLLTLLIPLLREHFKFLLFFFAVLASATWGIWPGVFATLLSAAMAAYFLLFPTHSWAASDPVELLRALFFCAASLAAVWVTQRVWRSEDRIRADAAVIESSADCIVRQSLDSTILSWNKAAESTYGYTAQEAIGRPASILVPSDFREELQSLIARVQQGGAVKNYETVLVRKDGTHVDVALTLSPVRDREGRTVGLSSITREITERKLTEDARRQLNEQLERQTHQMKLLVEMGELLQASFIPTDAYAVAARFAQKLMPAGSGALFEYSATRSNLEAAIRWGKPRQSEQNFLSPDECWALRTGHLHLVEDHTGLLCRHLPEPPPKWYVCAPIIGHAETLGMLHLRLDEPSGGLPDAALLKSMDLTWVARTVAERLALTLADMKLREALRMQSIRDPLTGWFNRRFMEETLEREISRAARSKGLLAVIMIDVDNFKEFNDSFGHEAGDVALQNICSMLKKNVRSEDVACRYGGDEFVIILPDTSPELAEQRAEEMRIAIGHVEV